MTTTEVKPFSTVIAKVRELASVYPDRVEECAYFAEGYSAPRCIIGHVLADMGVRPAGNHGLGYEVDGFMSGDLLAPDGSYFAWSGEFVHDLPWGKAGVDEPTSQQVTWVGRVQIEQDEKVPWRMAVATADTMIGAVS